MSRYDDAINLLKMADAASLRAREIETAGDPLAMLPAAIGAVVFVLVAQVHATLAVAEALQQQREEAS